MAKLSLEQLNRLSVLEYKKTEKIPVAIVLDNIRSASNVGAVFRTSDAFSLKSVVLCGITAQPPHREIQKTALGATETVEFVYYSTTKEAIITLKKLGYHIIGIEQTTVSEDLRKTKCLDQGHFAVVFGNEVDGISDDVIPLIDTFIEIPQFGTKHSLNVAVCAGIVMWEILKAHKPQL